MSVLVIAPHADDEVLGCGASIARHSAEGEDVIVAIMTNASVGAPELFPKAAVERVREESRSAHEVLGVRETVMFDFPAPCLDQHPQYLLSEAIGRLLQQFRPATVYLPHRGDLHHDHGIVFNAALVACRPLAHCSVVNVYAYETLSETEWAPPFSDDAFIPTHFVDVTDTLERKLIAMECYRSQLRDVPHPRSLSSLTALARLRGSTVSCAYAEAFMTVRTVRRMSPAQGRRHE